jgi:signal peptidase I
MEAAETSEASDVVEASEGDSKPAELVEFAEAEESAELIELAEADESVELAEQAAELIESAEQAAELAESVELAELAEQAEPPELLASTPAAPAEISVEADDADISAAIESIHEAVLEAWTGGLADTAEGAEIADEALEWEEGPLPEEDEPLASGNADWLGDEEEIAAAADGDGPQESVVRVWEIEYPEAEEPTYSYTKEETPAKQPRKPSKRAGKKNRRALGIISDVLFYVAVLLVLFSVVTAKPSDGSARVILGYSCYTVLTTSMEGEIPKDAFILVHEVDPQKLEIGDNITYAREQSPTVTHQIVNIYENYSGIGVRGFRTQGVNRESPDNEIVHEDKVLGKVVLVLPKLGAVISFLNKNIFLVFAAYGLCIILSFGIRWFSENAGNKKLPARVRQNKPIAS